MKAPPPDPNQPWYDKLIDYLVGDNPEQSVMLVCVNCRLKKWHAHLLFLKFV